MASMEVRLRRVSVPLSFHAAHYPSSCTEDLGDLNDQLDQVGLDPHGERPRMVTESPPCEIAWRALDLKFPLEESETDWSDWSEDDVDDGEVIDGDETDCPGRDYTKSDAKDIDIEYMDRYCQRMGAYSTVCDEIISRKDYGTPFPPFPLKVFPPATSACFKDGLCYHSVYKTHDTSTSRGEASPEKHRCHLDYAGVIAYKEIPTFTNL